METKKYYRALTIAGSDSGGGAGIQADLKTFSALGCYGMSVITALTAQNTKQVTGIFEVSPEFVSDQIDAVISDIGVDAVKIGMLQDSQVIKKVAEKISYYNLKNVVIDPVMVAKSGDKLLADSAIDTLKSELLPLAAVITPNIPEAEVLMGKTIQTLSDMENAAFELSKIGVTAVVLKGGHLENDKSPDYVYIQNQNSSEWLETERINTKNTHGTGCTFSSGIAAYLARGFDLLSAIKNAKIYMNSAIKEGADYKIGNGHGPVKHFYKLWKGME
jgi:hydroxymethylpyrimidine/phosphomethylpyrimidine kinase